MALILAQQNRGKTIDITIQDAAGGTIIPGVNDRVRVTIGRIGRTPELEVESGTPTVNGSSITTGAANRVRLDASDLDFDPGEYSFIVDYFDNADAQEYKTVERQVFQLEDR